MACENSPGLAAQAIFSSSAATERTPANGYPDDALADYSFDHITVGPLTLWPQRVRFWLLRTQASCAKPKPIRPGPTGI